MEDLLKYLLNRYQSLSNYAETKLSALILFNSSLLFAGTMIYINIHEKIGADLYVFIILTLITILFCFYGIYARTNNNLRSKQTNVEKNYFYYVYVKELSADDLLEGLINDCGLKLSENNNYNPSPTRRNYIDQIEKDCCNQIVTLANIMDRKFSAFNRSLYFTTGTLVLTAIKAIVLLFSPIISICP